jgi:hypothetical protein
VTALREFFSHLFLFILFLFLFGDMIELAFIILKDILQ